MAISVEHRSKFAALTGNGDLPSEKFSSGMISPKQNYGLSVRNRFLRLTRLYVNNN